MKYWITLIVVFLLAALIGSPAQAEIYKVKKGESLWSISQKFHQVTVDSLWQANKDKLSAKDLIHPGQKLEIPQRGFSYENPGENPFTRDRDPAKLVRKFDCPQEVKTKMSKIASKFLSSYAYYQVKEGDSLFKLQKKFEVPAEKIYKANKDVITHPKKWLFPGQTLHIPGKDSNISGPSKTIFLSSQEKHLSFLEQMLFGDYQMVDRVQVDFKTPQKAKRWRITGEKKNYYLVLPLNCFNWGWYKQPRKKKYKVILLPGFFGGKGEVPAATPAAEVERWRWTPSWDATAYAGHYKGIQGGNSDDYHQYVGGNVSLYPDSYQLGQGRFRFGPALHYMAWQGEADNAVDYSGDLRLLGGEAEYITSSHETSLTLYGGEKRGWVEGKGFPYRSNESADMLVVDGYHAWWYDRNWFPQMEIGTRMQFAVDESKNTYWDGTPIEEAPLQQGEYSARFKSDIYQNDVATPTLELNSGWREYSKSSFVEPRGGIEWFNDIAATDVSYQVVEGSENNSAGLHARLEVNKMVSVLAESLFQEQETKIKDDRSSKPYSEKLSIDGGSQELRNWVDNT